MVRAISDPASDSNSAAATSGRREVFSPSSSVPSMANARPGQVVDVGLFRRGYAEQVRLVFGQVRAALGKAIGKDAQIDID